MLIDPAEPWPALQQAFDDCEGLPSEILLIADKSRADAAVEALRGGVSDVLLRPFSTEDLVAAVTAICGAGGSRSRAQPVNPRLTLVGNSAPLRDIRSLAGHIAPCTSTVLIEGEAGTGRAQLARLLHEQSGRRGPFVAVECRTIDGERFDDEFFGQAVEAPAESGTLFLAEIHEMPLHLQAAMLRSIEKTVPDAGRGARIVASTRADLASLVARHRFRQDLYQRLNAVRIGMPPLRERRADIPLLVAHFIESLSAEMGLPRLELQSSELEALTRYDWPGNVAELRRAVEQTLLRGQLPVDAFSGAVDDRPATPDYPLDWTLEQVKRHHMACVLEACDGNKSAAARRLDISRKTLDRKLGGFGRE